MLNNPVYSATWTLTTFSDFYNGIHENTEIVGSGAGAYLTLSLGQVLFKDTFTEPDGPAQNWQPQRGNFEIIEKEYCSHEYEGYLAHSLSGDTSWTNYTLEAKCRIITSFEDNPNDPGARVGIIFRETGATNQAGIRCNFYHFRYISRPTPRLEIRRCQPVRRGWRWYTLISTETPALATSTWHVFRVDVINEGGNVRMRCFINNELKINYLDTVHRLLNGGIGLYNCRSHSHFDDVVVRQLTNNYLPNGRFTSSIFDTGGSTDFEKLLFSATTPTNTNLRFQIATNNDKKTWNFLGPDGSPNSYYQNSPTYIWSGHDGDRYIRIRAYLTTNDPTRTPALDEISLTYQVTQPDTTPPSDIDVEEIKDMKVGDTIKVIWDEAEESDVAYYNIYYKDTYFIDCSGASLAGSVSVGNNSFDVMGLIPNKMYYFAVTAVDTSGNEDKLVSPTEVLSGYPTFGSILVIWSDTGISGSLPNKNTIVQHLDNIGYQNNYGLWSKKHRKMPSVEILNNFNIVLHFSGSKYANSIISSDAAALSQYVDAGGNVALFGSMYGYDAFSDGWYNQLPWSRLFRVRHDGSPNNNDEWETNVGSPQIVKVTINHPTTSYIGQAGTQFIARGGPSLEGYETVLSNTTEVLSWTQGKGATIDVAAIAYDGHNESRGRIFYFSGVFRDVAGNGIEDPGVRENLLRGVLEWLSQPATTVSYITLLPQTATVVAKTTQTFTAQGYDEYGNPIPGLTYSWAVLGNIGTVLPVTGSTVTFTATDTSTFIQGTITATSDIVIGTASVSVQPKMISINVTPDSINWGALPSDTLTPLATITITNTGSIKEDFYFSLGSFTTGSYEWHLGTTTGVNRCVFEYSTDTTTYHKVLTYNTSISLFTGVDINTSKNIYLRLKTPKTTTSTNPYRAYAVFIAEATP